MSYYYVILVLGVYQKCPDNDGNSPYLDKVFLDLSINLLRGHFVLQLKGWKYEYKNILSRMVS